MVRYVISLCLILFAMEAPAAIQQSAVPFVKLGASSLTPAGGSEIYPSQIPTYFPVTCYSNGGTANRFAPCLKGGSAWQVAGTGKAHCFNIFAAASGASRGWQFVWATAAITYEDTALTGGKYQYGATEYRGNTTSATATLETPHSWTISFDASSYPGIQYAGTNSQWVTMNCFQQ